MRSPTWLSAPSRNRGRPPTAPTPSYAPRRARQCLTQTWCILHKLRCCPWKAGQLAKAIHVLQTHETRITLVTS
jgi:hypothetical protein